jgi:hypothetical protein
MSKPDCYACKHRAPVGGDTHSCCLHPKNQEMFDNPLAQVMANFAGVGRVDPVFIETGLNIKANPHGVRMGWFNWPFNFDPVWLESCDGFEAKQVEAKGAQ